MQTNGRLVRKFVSDRRLRDLNFRKALTLCLTSLEGETLDGALSKGQGMHKDTVHPQFAIAWGIGSPLDVSWVYKRTRDDVLWGEASEFWRRSRRWMLLHVATQTTIAGPGGDHTRYKLFMIYFLATVLDLAVQNDFPSDMLHIMLAKINRRVLKLNLVPDDLGWAEQIQEYTTDIMESTRRLLTKGWSTVQKSTDSAGTFRLVELKKLKLKFSQAHKDGFRIRLSLLDLECWVSNFLDSWLERHAKSEMSLVKLSKVISWYMETSVKLYYGSPEGFSMMVSTLMLLWTALDKAVVSHFPLLSKFDPDFPTTLFESFLLPKRHQLRQLRQLRDIERHLLRRKENAVAENPSVFEDVSWALSFGAQYFDQSLVHQTLMERIEREAEDKSDEKKAELKAKQIEFSTLTAKSNALSCSTIMKAFGRGRNKDEREVHDPNCLKCDPRKQAQSLKIHCYEWPLPPAEPQQNLSFSSLTYQEIS